MTTTTRQIHPTISRRNLLGGLAFGSISQGTVRQSAAQTTHPFRLGVASGDPHADSVVLWTRLSAEALSEEVRISGTTELRWEMATDQSFSHIVAAGSAIASVDDYWTCRAIPEGLAPSTSYFYRFQHDGRYSPVGNTRTTPVPGSRLETLRFSIASCANWEHGYYSAYQDMAEQNLDFILFLGDYIYEYARDALPTERQIPAVRFHGDTEADSLDGYRERYALYKSDQALQSAHAACPWIVTWDDHEVVNDYQADVGPAGATEATFLDRRAAAFHAFYEHQPLRPSARPVNGYANLYRRFQFGDLAEFNVLDGRQYRTPQPCGQGIRPRCDAVADPRMSMLGADQEAWLLDGLGGTGTIWNLIAQQTMMAELRLSLPGSEPRFSVDQWDGYPAARQRILGPVAAGPIENTVILTGDLHSAWVADLKTDFRDPDAPTIATEIVTTSITSENPLAPLLGLARISNSHLKWFDSNQGYTLCELDRDEMRISFRAVQDVNDPESSVATISEFTIRSGIPGATQS